MTKLLLAVLLFFALESCASAPRDLLNLDSRPVSYTLVVTIRDGQLEEFRAVMEEMVAATRQEPGTFVYEWFLTTDSKTCHINEWFRDTAAHAVHGRGFAKFADRFMPCVEIVSMTVYGDPEKEARSALAGLNPKYLGGFGGFRR